MRSRNIKPGFFKNADLADAGPYTQLLFAGLWCMADRRGRLKDLPRVIKAEVFPYYEVDINRELTALERLSLIHRYVVDGLAVIQVVNFLTHQSPHHTEKESVLPVASDCFVTAPVIHREVTTDSPLTDGGNPSDSLIHDSLIHEPAKPGPASKARRAPKTPIPPDFALTPALTDYITAKLPGVDPVEFLASFKEATKASGSVYADWASALQKWTRNAAPGSGHFAEGKYPRRAPPRSSVIERRY